MWEILDKIETRITALQDKARLLTQPEPAQSRELISVFYQEVSIPYLSLNERRVTVYNGDRDEWVIQRLSAFVVVVTAAAPTQRITLSRQADGWPANTRFSEIRSFDFVWNYAVNSRQSLYSRDNASTSANYLTSAVLATQDSARMLDWHYPLVIPPSDSIEFRVKPICADPLLDATYFVGFAGFGYRRML